MGAASAAAPFVRRKSARCRLTRSRHRASQGRPTKTQPHVERVPKGYQPGGTKYTQPDFPTAKQRPAWASAAALPPAPAAKHYSPRRMGTPIHGSPVGHQMERWLAALSLENTDTAAHNGGGKPAPAVEEASRIWATCRAKTGKDKYGWPAALPPMKTEETTAHAGKRARASRGETIAQQPGLQWERNRGLAPLPAMETPTAAAHTGSD